MNLLMGIDIGTSSAKVMLRAVGADARTGFD